jgi:hypothetical protein
VTLFGQDGFDWEASARVAHPRLSCRTSPPQVGRSTRGDGSITSDVAIEAGVCAQPISLLVGEMPGRAEGGTTRTADARR